MEIKLGSDIVYIPKFEKAFQENEEYFLQKVFRPEEQNNLAPEHLAGIFAAKEAVMKALGIGPGKWQEISVAHFEDGRPYVAVAPLREHGWHHELSIAHDGEYAIASVVFYKTQHEL